MRIEGRDRQGNRVKSSVELSKESVMVRGRSWRSKDEGRFWRLCQR